MAMLRALALASVASLAQDEAALGSLPPFNLTDYNGELLPPDSAQVQLCRSAAARKLTRRDTKYPDLYIDPLSPLPLADAARPRPTVRLVYYIMASRGYAYETINRNVRALQHPGALEDVGTNESNLFLLHLDAKMAPEAAARLRAGLHARPDVYELRERRAVMWSGFSMVLALLDAMASLLARGLGFEMLINLSDADLTLRTDGELRAFFARYPGRSVLSIVQKSRDPRRYRSAPRRIDATLAERALPWARSSARWRVHSATPPARSQCTRTSASFAGSSATRAARSRSGRPTARSWTRAA